MHERLARVRSILRERGLDGAVVTHPANRRRLTGFTGHDVLPDNIVAGLFLDGDRARLLTGKVNVAWAESELDGTGIEVGSWERPWSRSIAKEIKERGWSRVGFEDAAISYAMYRDISSELNGVELVALGDALTRLRVNKDAEEIARYERIARIGDSAFVAATRDLTAGTTERELAARIDAALEDHGSEGTSFQTIVASGPNAARPHHDPSDRPIAEGEPVIIDMGAQLDGYHGDLTRTIWVGEPSARLQEVYAVVEQAQAAGIARMRVGATYEEPDAAARVPVEAAGFGEYFIHGLGHGVGLNIHELPFMAKGATDTFAGGEVITVEPGVYLPEWGGVRIEDLGVVETDGFRRLTAAPKHSFL